MTTIYTLEKGKSASGMAQAVKQYLRTEEQMEVRILELPNGELVIQGKAAAGRLRLAIGLERSVSVKLIPIGAGNVAVETEHGRLSERIQRAAKAYLTAVEMR